MDSSKEEALIRAQILSPFSKKQICTQNVLNLINTRFQGVIVFKKTIIEVEGKRIYGFIILIQSHIGGGRIYDLPTKENPIGINFI